MLVPVQFSRKFYLLHRSIPILTLFTQGEGTEDVSCERVHTQALFQCPPDMSK